MKLCPNCKVALDDNARFCLCCMTSLEEKEQIPPPMHRVRRWPLVLVCCLLSGVLLFFVIYTNYNPPRNAESTPAPTVIEDPSLRTSTIDGVQYTFRPATSEDHPTAISLANYFVLIRVEGKPADGIYRIPTFVGDDLNSLVTVVADGAFSDTNARAIDLGHNVRYVWGNAFGGYPLSDLYLHTDVLIDQKAFSGCGESLTIHGPDYLENTIGQLWSELTTQYGFQWQTEIF